MLGLPHQQQLPLEMRLKLKGFLKDIYIVSMVSSEVLLPGSCLKMSWNWKRVWRMPLMMEDLELTIMARMVKVHYKRLKKVFPCKRRWD